MLPIFAALAPVFLLILMGFLVRRFRVVDDGFWGPADRMNYYLFFPCLIMSELATADLGPLVVWPMAAAMAGGVAVAGGLMLAFKPLMRLEDAGFSSVFQGAMRPNTYVGLAGAKALFGAPGLTLSAVGIAVVLPLVNVLCVAALSRWGTHSRGGSARAILGSLLRNPIILAAATGAWLNLTGVGKPPVAGPIIEILGRAALPIGLLSVGAGLDLAAARLAGMAVAIASVAKLLLAPAATALIGGLLGVQGVTLAVAVLFNALPCSVGAYALARQMGGDHGLVAAIITVQTLLAAATIPVMLMAFG